MRFRELMADPRGSPLKPSPVLLPLYHVRLMPLVTRPHATTAVKEPPAALEPDPESNHWLY